MKSGLEFESLELPDDLRALDAELDSIRYEERASFAPELRAELAHEWAQDRPVRHNRFRPLAAAAAVAVLFVGAGVPQARASLVRWIGDALDEAPVVSVTPPTPRAPAIMASPSPVEESIVPDLAPSRSPIVPLERPATRGPVVERDDWPAPTMPELADRPRAQGKIQRAYPLDLQRAGVGGTVGLLLFVDSTGAVEHSTQQTGSGVAELDRAALTVGRSLRFTPSTRRGERIPGWVQFDVIFRPSEEEVDPYALPAIDPVLAPEIDAPLDLALLSEWQGDVSFASPIRREAGELLEAALGADVLDDLGSVEAILAGDPPSGVAPTQWRVDVGRALEAAMVREPDNPAPLLALSRIRLQQGLRTESKILLERGLQRALRVESGVSPTLFAELHHRRGELVKESWIAARRLGRLPSEALTVTDCPQARSSGGAAGGYASVERLIAWNYLCPAALGEAFQERFEEVGNRAEADAAVMMGSFRTAVEAQPEHPGANVQILLALSDEGRWPEVLNGARRFVRASMGHPYGLLLGGIALQRLSRTEEARDQFALALRGLAGPEAESIRDISSLLLDDQRLAYSRTSGDDRREFERAFWAPLDPILATEVNEREIEHLARAAYADLRFGSTAGDAAEVWIRYGRPVAVRTVGERSTLRTEFWDYGNGPDITFSRLGTASGMDLTAEAREYVEDLREVFPHRYGAAARTVFTLPAQVSRFRTSDGTGRELEIHTEVPVLLATGETDTLDVGVFMLDAEGNRVAVAQRKVLAVPAPVTFRTPAAPNVRSVVVEVFNRSTGQAAALREVVSGDDDGQTIEISDIMVVGATGSRGDVARDARWLDPLTLVGPLDADAVGVYFELYHAGPASRWYRVRAEIEDRDSGTVVGVPIRPAGESGFRPTWDRYFADEGATREFFTVALSDVDPGRHLVRVVLDMPDAGRALIASRPLDRR